MGCNTSTPSKVGCEAPPPPPIVAVTAPPEIKVEVKAKTPAPSIAPSVALEPVEEQFCHAKLLLLGSAESGKTTLLEQIRLLYKKDYSEAEVYHRRSFIYFYVLKSMRHLIEALKASEEYDFDNLESRNHADVILNQHESQRGLFPDHFANWIRVVWNDSGIQKVYQKRSKFNISDNIKYFLDNFDLINSLEYTPTPKDYIMCYVPTIGIQSVLFTANKQSFQIIDVGGQKLARKKWEKVYDGIDAIFFCIAVSEYDQVMNEDPTMNRIVDAMSILKQVSAEPCFTKTPIFLFLNECDIFFEKIGHTPLQDYFPDYTGVDEDEALNFIEDLATEAANREKSLFKVLRVVAIDTEPMKKTLQKAFKDVVKIKNS